MKRTEKKSQSKLSASEARLINILLEGNFDLMDRNEICRKAKISNAAYDRYMQDERFHDLLRKKNLDRINRDVLEIVRTFKEKALGGSFNHGKALLELAGYYKSKGHDDKKDEDIILVSHIPRPDIESEK